MIEYALRVFVSNLYHDLEVVYSLPVARLHNPDTTPGDVPETDVEPTELVANDEEHAEWLLRVLDFGKEIGSQAEGESDLRGLVEVGLQDMPTTNN